MKLQTDPTILYSLYLERGFDIEKNIRRADILFNSPYNTYVVKGLPPNPIANPGEESLQAVFKPEKSNYLYFVSKNNGHHKFSKTYKEHQKAVQKISNSKETIKSLTSKLQDQTLFLFLNLDIKLFASRLF